MDKLRFFLPILILGFIVILPFNNISAQCTGPNVGSDAQGPCCLIPKGCGPDPECRNCVPVPLDVGMSALLIAGIAFGAKRVYG
jgi:hypothetical protein